MLRSHHKTIGKLSQRVRSSTSTHIRTLLCSTVRCPDVRLLRLFAVRRVLERYGYFGVLELRKLMVQFQNGRVGRRSDSAGFVDNLADNRCEFALNDS